MERRAILALLKCCRSEKQRCRCSVDVGNQHCAYLHDINLRRRAQLFASWTAAGKLITRRRCLCDANAWTMPMTKEMLSTEPIKAEIDISVARESDRDRLLDFIRLHYYAEEPLTFGSEPKQQEPADEEFNMSNIKHETCLMAIRHIGEGNEEIIGAVIAGPKDCHELEHLEEEAKAFGSQSKWGRILGILAHIERSANVFERFGIERALHVHALGVHRCARGLALGKRLMQELIVSGRKKNFQLITVDCTSVYSARLCEGLGMECVNVLRYEDYLDKDGNQVFRPPPPHDCVRTYALRL